MHPCVRPSTVGCHLITKSDNSRLQMNLSFWWKTFIIVFRTQKSNKDFFEILFNLNPWFLTFPITLQLGNCPLSQVTHDFKKVSWMKQFPVQNFYMLQSTQGLVPPGNLLTPLGMRTLPVKSHLFKQLELFIITH